MTTKVINVAVLGNGRMGQQVARVLEESEDCRVAGIWRRDEPESLEDLLKSADVAIDFTLPDASDAIVRTAVLASTPLVCGVTGLDANAMAALSGAATKIPLLYDRNMSLGIAIMTDLIRRTSAALGPDFSAEILETHHIHKQDAPSGTAIALQKAIAKRPVTIESQREGDVIGKHRVRFVSANETLEFEHDVSDRDVFARGAVSAARWLIQQPVGLYDMADIAVQIHR
jgi:4-hydroxy-tetrahydrodipicolinate reductase